MADKSLKMSVYGRDVNASKTLQDIGKHAQHTGGLLGKIGTIAAGISLSHLATEAGDFVKESLGKFAEVAGEVKTLQRYTGGSAESLSGLRETAKMSGVGVDVLSKSLGKLSAFMNTNKNASKLLGVSVKDSSGHLKNMDAVLPGIMDHFAKMPNSTQKTADILKVFGRNGMAILPFLNRGSEGLAKFSEEAEKNGLILSQSNLDAVTKNTMAQREFHSALEGLQVQIGMKLYPIMTQMTQAFLKQWPTIRTQLEPAMKMLGTAAQTLGNVVQTIVLPAISGLGQWLQKYSGWIIPIVGSIGAMVIAWKTYTMIQTAARIAMELYKAGQIIFIALTSGMEAAQIGLTFATEGGTVSTGAMTAAQWLLNAAMDANPIGLIVLALVALTAGFVIAYKHSETFRRIVTGAFKSIKAAFGNIWDGMSEAAGKVFDVIGKLVKGYINIWIGLINYVIGALNKIHFKIPDIKGVPDRGKEVGINIAQIPYLASGGIVSSPTLAMIGEAGPEAVVPLSRLNGGAMSSQPMIVNIHVAGSVVQENDLAVKVRDSIAQMMRRTGNNPSILGV